jgi:hypothetical protein
LPSPWPSRPNIIDGSAKAVDNFTRRDAPWQDPVKQPKQLGILPIFLLTRRLDVAFFFIWKNPSSLPVDNRAHPTAVRARAPSRGRRRKASLSIQSEETCPRLPKPSIQKRSTYSPPLLAIHCLNWVRSRLHIDQEPCQEADHGLLIQLRKLATLVSKSGSIGSLPHDTL